MIIYPPLIADTIPGFTMNKIVIPFFQNPAVSFDEVNTFKLLIKDYITSQIIASSIVTKDNVIYNEETRSGTVEFEADSLYPFVPSVKRYYKFQISYGDYDELYTSYSSVAIGKCIGDMVNISIDGLKSSEVNDNKIEYIGNYSTIGSESVYSYRFVFTEEKEVDEIYKEIILQDTGDILHNSDNDIIYGDSGARESKHLFRLAYDLEDGVKYKIKFTITTINNYTTSVEYYIKKAQEMAADFPLEINIPKTISSIENGYIELQFYASSTDDLKGEYMLQRTIGNGKWEEVIIFRIDTILGEVFELRWKDYSIEHGVNYKYGLRKRDQNNIWSARKEFESTSASSEFEHVYLTDGEKQLKIAFNPKISSFKDNILEQKMDTIGSKYPFIFRNGQVGYKEIPISGLISYCSDDNGLFNPKNNFLILDTNLNNNNIVLEREFKLEVLEWLNNGKPKLFRSPTEGNYIVRIMNVSLSPVDTLGRMVHTFNAVSYEIADNTFDNLCKNKLVNFNSFKADNMFVSQIGSFLLNSSVLGGY